MNSHPSLNKITVINSHVEVEGGLLILVQLSAEELGRKIILCPVVQSLRSVSLTGGSMRNLAGGTTSLTEYQQYVNEVTVLNILVIIDDSSEQQHC